MARQPVWFERLDRALAELRALQVCDIDRALVEQLFGLHRRDAIRLLHRFGASESQNRHLSLPRLALLAQLEGLRESSDYQNWVYRRERHGSALAASAAVQNARQIRVPVLPRIEHPAVDGLPDSIRLRPGLLEIRFQGEEDLWSQLELLSRAAAADREGFHQCLEALEE